MTKPVHNFCNKQKPCHDNALRRVIHCYIAFYGEMAATKLQPRAFTFFNILDVRHLTFAYTHISKSLPFTDQKVSFRKAKGKLLKKGLPTILF